MKNATFYLLDQHAISDGLTAVERLACDLAADKWRQGKQVLIACEDDAQALRLDEALWARDPIRSCRTTWRGKVRATVRR